MRTIIMAALLPLAACGVGASEPSSAEATEAGTARARTYSIADFIGVELRGPDDVEVRVGSAFSVRAEGNPKVIEKLRITKVGDTLRVAREHGFTWGSVKGARVFVTMPRMAAASLAGSGDLSIDRVTGNSFVGVLAGSGTLKIATLDVPAAKLSIAGSGDLYAAGVARRIDASVAGSGDIDAVGLRAAKADVSISGSGDIRLTVDGEAAVSIMGSGDAILGGGARCTVSKMGSGEARCWG